MRASTYGFSLIEIIISTIILTIGVFGVYKLIGNNMNYIGNNESLLTQNSLLPPLRECIKSLGFLNINTNYNSGDIFSINFGSGLLGCGTGTYNNLYNFSGVIINNNEYFLYGKINEKSGNKIKIEVNIFSDNNGLLFKSGSNTESSKYLILTNN